MLGKISCSSVLSSHWLFGKLSCSQSCILSDICVLCLWNVIVVPLVLTTHQRVLALLSRAPVVGKFVLQSCFIWLSRYKSLLGYPLLPRTPVHFTDWSRMSWLELVQHLEHVQESLCASGHQQKESKCRRRRKKAGRICENKTEKEVNNQEKGRESKKRGEVGGCMGVPARRETAGLTQIEREREKPSIGVCVGMRRSAL